MTLLVGAWLVPASPAAVVLDQIGPLTSAGSYDFSGLPEPTLSQFFPVFPDFDTTVLENFSVTSDQLEIVEISVVFRALGGFEDFSNLQGFAVNVFSDINLAAAGSGGDLVNMLVTAPEAFASEIVDTGGLHEYALVRLEVDLTLPSAGEYWVGVSPVGNAATLGQFMVLASPVSLPDSPDARLANPGEGFGVGPLSLTGNHQAYAVTAVPEPGVLTLSAFLGCLLLTRRSRTRPES